FRMRMKTRSNSARPLHEQLLEEARARIKGAEADRQLQTPPLNDDVYLSSPASPDDVIDVVGTYHDEGLDDVIEELESYDSDYETVQIPSGYDDGQRRTMMGTEDHDYYASDGYTTDETVAYREEMDHEQRFDIESTDFIDVTSIDNDDDDYIVEMPEEEEDHASAYEQYMMHRVESEQEDEAAEAERETHEREMARRQREADAERARAAERDRLMIEKNRQFKEQHEGRKLERLRDALEREEAVLSKQIEAKQAMLLQTEGQHTQDRFQQSENEENERAAIAHMIDELRIREQRLRDMVAAREAQEADLLQQQQELLAARQKADAIRQERIKATKDSDDHPHSLALRYSRGCGV
ncbi:hypothetical protein PENTCL1PPCAC_24032, partial [Pristionchus entomophagus]